MNDKILNSLFVQNPWWLGESLSFPATQRQLFPILQTAIDSARITAVVGMRRVGKTTLFIQLIQQLLKRGVEAKSILYFSADAVEFQTITHPIKESFDLYREQIAPKQKKLYLFIDEAHFAPDWALELKNIWDRYQPKIFITGSSALFILKNSRESLTGRIQTFHLPPLSFREFIELRGISLEISELSLPTRIEGKSLIDFAEEIAVRPLFLEKWRRTLYPQWQEYLVRGGFPEGLKVLDQREFYRLIREDIIDRVLFKDVPQLFAVGDRRLLYDLFLYSIYNSGELFSYHSLAQNFKTKVHTVSNYLTYLSSARLLLISEKYSGSFEGIKKANKKLYVADIGIRNAFLRIHAVSELHREVLGKMVETVAVSRAHYLAQAHEGHVFYWRNRGEVDLVFRIGTNVIPVEIKYRSQLDQADLRGLAQFAKTFDAGNGILVTENVTGVKQVNGIKIGLLPIWVMLLLE